MSTVALCALAALSACNGSGDGTAGSNDKAAAAAHAHSLDAAIVGLNSSGLALMVNLYQLGRGNENTRAQRADGGATIGLPGIPCLCNWGGHEAMSISVPAQSTMQQLAGSLASGVGYSVTILAQPLGELCSVEDGTGTVSVSAPQVTVSCVDQSYGVGGSITGLTAGGLVLLDNGGDALTVGANATQFAMSTPVTYGSHYAITVQTSPTGLVCNVSNGAGTMGAAAVTSVAVGCLPNFTLLHSFVGGSSDGSELYHVLLQASDGSFYGTTWKGGASNGGVVFAVTASGTASVLYSFASTPYAGLMQAGDGNFYGTTAGGGAHNRGTVFKLTPGGVESTLFSFPSGGSDPYTGVIQGNDGNFYGTTGAGGSQDRGTVFELTPSGTETVLHVFPETTTTDGQEPYAGVIQGSDGNFYGTTYFGGSSGNGVVFEVTPDGTETVLHSFAGGSGDGANPYAGLIQGSDGNFYGTTYNGGSYGLGTVYRITPGGTETVLYSFVGGSGDGAYPEAGLTLGSDGNLYGATYEGGPGGLGAVFRLTPGGNESILHFFAGGSSDGANPTATLVPGTDGNLYGSTAAGGSSGDGTFFKVALR
jgi:uncharacterized repeat protein (TIGR03803 family)